MIKDVPIDDLFLDLWSTRPQDVVFRGLVDSILSKGWLDSEDSLPVVTKNYVCSGDLRLRAIWYIGNNYPMTYAKLFPTGCIKCKVV